VSPVAADASLTQCTGKKSAHTDNPTAENASESSEEDATDADMANDSFATVDTQPAQTDGSDAKDLGFTFSADAASVDELPDYESMDEDDQQSSTRDVPFAHIFRSPVKGAPVMSSVSPAKVEYPQLPQDDDQPSADESTEDLEVVETTEIAEPETATTRPSDETSGVAYPVLSDPEDSQDAQSEDDESEELSEVVLDDGSIEKQDQERNAEANAFADEEFTEASLQLNIQREYETAYNDAEPVSTRSQLFSPTEGRMKTDDITNGLTLSLTPTKPSSAKNTPRKLHSPLPPLRIESGPEDATMTIALDDDTAILKSFLSRAAASKAEKAANISRRESLENRRDSDIVRHALASPRKVLEDKDPNSPSKYDQDVTVEAPEALPANTDTAEEASPTPEQTETGDKSEQKPARASRRSARAKTSRLPAPASAAPAQASKIAIRRVDGNEHVVLKKSDAQELALITRNNTRKNKQGAFTVNLRLLKLATEAIMEPLLAEKDTPKEPAPGKKTLRWDEQLAYYQEHADTTASQIAEAESLSTPDELSLPAAPVTKSRVSKDNSTPKIRRVRGLGTANGTPGKGLLTPASLLPEAVQKEQDAPAPKALPKPSVRPTKMKKPIATSTVPAPSPKLAPLEVTPVGIEPAKERKSRLATPKKVKLSTVATVASSSASASAPGASAAPNVGKENAATSRPGPLKKSIPAPKVYTPAPAAPVAGVESGLPRRRGRKI
jgi:hypothetical protein